VIEIRSSKNQIIKEIKSLYRRRNRWKNNLYIIEGIKIVDEAISHGIDFKYILFTDKLMTTKQGIGIYNKIREKENIIKTNESIFQEVSDTDNPQGILAVVKFKERDVELSYSMETPFLLFLDGIQDPGNMGTIIRTGDAFNIDGIILGKGSVDPYNPKVVRSTMGSIFRTPLYFCGDNIKYLNKVRKSGISVLTTTMKGKAIYEGNLGRALLLVIGNESSGVSQDIVEISDENVTIPILGKAESLNAGIAASIIMYEAMKSRH